MGTVDLYLVTYGNGHTVLMDGAEAREHAEFSVSRGFSTREDREGGVFVLTSREDGRSRRYEPVMDLGPSQVRRFSRYWSWVSDDGLSWEATGIVSASAAKRVCVRQVNRESGRLVYLTSGTMVLIVRRLQRLRYKPVPETGKTGVRW